MSPLTCAPCSFSTHSKAKLAGHKRSYSHKICEGQARMKAQGWVPLPAFKYQYTAPHEEILHSHTKGHNGKVSTFTVRTYVPKWVKAIVEGVKYAEQERVIKKIMKSETAQRAIETIVAIDSDGVLEWLWSQGILPREVGV